MNQTSVCKILLAATAAVGAVPLQASSIVLNANAAVDQSNFARNVGYNYNATGYTLSDTTVPCNLPGCVSATLSSSGLTDSQGKATTGSESAQANITFDYFAAGTDPSTGTIVSANATAFAAASLENGTVQASGSGTFLDSFPNPNSGQNGGSGIAFAQFNDGLHFTIAGASANTVSLIGISYTLDGSILGTSGGASIDNILQFGSATLRDDIAALFPSQPPSIKNTQTAGWEAFSFTSNTPGLIIFDGTYALVGPEVDLGIAATLSLGCQLGADCDYTNTGQFKIKSLPSNVTFTSDSGVFLTGASSTTPEPGSLVLLGAGLTAVLLLRKRVAS